jgi:hypothetical protein
MCLAALAVARVSHEAKIVLASGPFDRGGVPGRTPVVSSLLQALGGARPRRTLATEMEVEVEAEGAFGSTAGLDHLFKTLPLTASGSRQ